MIRNKSYLLQVVQEEVIHFDNVLGSIAEFRTTNIIFIRNERDNISSEDDGQLQDPFLCWPSQSVITHQLVYFSSIP